MTVYLENPRTGRAEVYNCIPKEHATPVCSKHDSRQFYHTPLMICLWLWQKVLQSNKLMYQKLWYSINTYLEWPGCRVAEAPCLLLVVRPACSQSAQTAPSLYCHTSLLTSATIHQKMLTRHHRALVYHTNLLKFNLNNNFCFSKNCSGHLQKPHRFMLNILCKYFTHVPVLISLWFINWQSDHDCNILCAVIQCKLFLINELSLHESGTLTECKHWHSYLPKT